MIAAWRASGYTVKLVFLSLPTPEDAIARVAARVAQGGHDVPAATVRRRFTAGLRNFRNVYRPKVDYWQWFDNSGDDAVLRDEGGHP
jgi:predicted ABC-type ATPase